MIYVLICLLNIFDALFTYHYFKIGKIKEINPIMKLILNYNPNMFLTIKLSLVPIGLYYLWLNRHNNKVKYYVLIIFIVYSLLVFYELCLIGFIF